MSSDDTRDNVVIENYSVSNWDTENNDWTFETYGTRKSSQTFHAQHQATGQHGPVADHDGDREQAVSEEPLAVVASGDDVRRHVSTYVVVEGVYEQQDVRMRPPTPEPLYEGHVALVLSDGARVYLYPQQQAEARRSAEERERFEHRRVRATGLLFATNPGPGAVIKAPCLADISSLEPVD